MCGIAGYIGRWEIGTVRAEKCLALMGRRRPVANGIYRHSIAPGCNVLLIHSKLFVTDQDARLNQPLRIGSKVLAYNGRLYDCPELKEELSKLDHDFATKSDAEVLLRTIIEFGWQKGLDKCEGMWAFALYDEENGSLLLSRDRFGEKPLYIFRDDTGLYFGSEVKFLFELVGHKLDINYNHIYRYLVNGYKALYKTKETFFMGLEELHSGHILIVNGPGNEKLVQYWKLDFSQKEDMSFDEAVSGTREKLICSVKRRLRSDVPVAFCMSGGIDSNCLIGIAKQVLAHDVHALTIVNTDERYAEQDLVDHAVSKLGVEHTSVPMTTDNFISNLRNLIRYHVAPVYTISYYAHWLLMEHIREKGYRISVSGSGGDELFSGYYDHHALYLKQICNDSKLYEESLENWNKHIRPIVRNPFLQEPDVFIKDPDFRGHIYLDADQFAGYLKPEWSEPFVEEKFDTSLMRMRMLNELFYESGPVMLHEDNLNAMYCFIENRSPFMDRELFEFSLCIPTKYLIRNGYAKAVLREAMRGIVPDKILDNRRKVGFNAPIFSFLDVQDPEIRSYLLDQSPIFDHVGRDKIEALVSKPNLPNSESKFLFYFLCSKVFLEEFKGR